MLIKLSCCSFTKSLLRNGTTKIHLNLSLCPLITLIFSSVFRAMAEMVLKEHGDTVGVTRPRMFLITRDLDLLKKILVKDFNNFSDRWYKIVSTSPASRGVFFLDGVDWKRIRQLMSPSFRSVKGQRVPLTGCSRQL